MESNPGCEHNQEVWFQAYWGRVLYCTYLPFLMLNSPSKLERRCCFSFSITIEQELRVYVTVWWELKPGQG